MPYRFKAVCKGNSTGAVKIYHFRQLLPFVVECYGCEWMHLHQSAIVSANEVTDFVFRLDAGLCVWQHSDLCKTSCCCSHCSGLEIFFVFQPRIPDKCRKVEPSCRELHASGLYHFVRRIVLVSNGRNASVLNKHVFFFLMK